jgi:eukaryotic-like serine/threonine-protein kinase
MITSGAQAQSTPGEVVDPLIGRVLNERFRIVEELGAGGMGRVYKAVQAPLDRPVALKVLNPQYSEGKDPGFQKRFFLEAAVTAKLRHPNTVTIIDYGKSDDIFYIAMEYLEGQTLAQLLTQHGPMAWERVLNIGQQVARSLREAHRVGLIHRDLKPANIMVLNQEADHDVVKVLDFGLVKSFLPDRGLPNETELTQAGVILGSPQYMAPEQARNVSDPRSDVYSLGVVLYQMLVGRPPFQAQQSIDVIFKHLNEPPPIFSAVRPGHQVPQEVEALVMRCLYKRPEERFQSMDEMLEALRRAASSSGLSGVFSGPRTGLMSIPVSGSGPLSGPLSGPSSAPLSGPRALADTTGANTVALNISVAEPVKPTRRALPVALFGGSLLLGMGMAAVLALRAPEPAPTPAPAPAAPVARPPPPSAEQTSAPAAALVARPPPPSAEQTSAPAAQPPPPAPAARPPPPEPEQAVATPEPPPSIPAAPARTKLRKRARPVAEPDTSAYKEDPY